MSKIFVLLFSNVLLIIALNSTISSDVSNKYAQKIEKNRFNECNEKYSINKCNRALNELLKKYFFKRLSRAKNIDLNKRLTRINIQWNNGTDGPWAMGCDFVGNDLSNIASKGEECSGKCKSTNRCTHYSWTKFNGGTCWMKKGSVSQSNAKDASEDSVCGFLIKTPIKWNERIDGVWVLKCDFNSNDLSNQKSSSENCFETCSKKSGCTHYTWSNFNGGTCWMKQGPVSRSNAFNKDGDFICGIITNVKKPPPLKKRNLLWSDEFEGDLSEWIQETGGHGWGNGEFQYYTDNNRNARIENGYLTIKAKREQFDKNNYTSARLISKRAFKYGIIEARLKIPPGRGTWPAFWLLSAKRPINWPNDGEIDLMEHWGCTAGEVLVNIHTQKYNHIIGTNRGNGRIIPNLFDDFHTYKLDWNTERLIFYIDNFELFRYENTEKTHEALPFDEEFNVLLNLAVHNMRCNGNVDENAFPASYVIDYVRLYRN